MHIHNEECKHELKHCQHCDIVYCEKCSKEWGGKYLDYIEPKWNDRKPYDTVTYLCKNHTMSNN